MSTLIRTFLLRVFELIIALSLIMYLESKHSEQLVAAKEQAMTTVSRANIFSIRNAMFMNLYTQQGIPRFPTPPKNNLLDPYNPEVRPFTALFEDSLLPVSPFGGFYHYDVISTVSNGRLIDHIEIYDASPSTLVTERFLFRP